VSGVAERLGELGLTLPDVVPPVAAYVPAVRNGSLVWTSGQLPMVGGQLVATGLVGSDVTAEDAKDLARTCALNALAAVGSVADLDSVVRVVKVVGFVASAPGFYGQPGVINGASELLGEVFGENGRHARSAVGVAVLPLNAPVEVEIVVEVS
jgi:enamine deaminase RidA (YjgF/YER057c/UK114 family)